LLFDRQVIDLLEHAGQQRRPIDDEHVDKRLLLTSTYLRTLLALDGNADALSHVRRSLRHVCRSLC
jgi:hypothetical protein